MTRWVARVLVLAAVGWCVGLGLWLWVTPIPYNGVASSAYADSSGAMQQATYQVAGSRSFADVSALGPAPLLIPTVIAALAALAVWRGRILPAAIATGILLVYVVLAGFSIGAGYVPAAGALVWAIIARADS